MYEAPAVQFYFGDFLNDTADMTLEERGAYITLLGYAWINVGIPLEEKKIRRILGISPHKFSKIWPELLPKFFAMPDGYMNPRMEEERAKQIAYRAKKAAAGAKGGQAKAASSASGSPEANGQQKPSPSSSSPTSPSVLESQSTTTEPTSIDASSTRPVVRAESDEEVRAHLDELRAGLESDTEETQSQAAA